MFGKEKPTSSGSSVSSEGLSGGGITLISKGTKIKGDLHFSGNLEVEGVIEGNIIADDNSVGAVRILETGLVKGQVKAPIIVINGNVEGDVISTEHIELANKAVVIGNVYYHLIEMVKGAQVNGSLMYHKSGSKAEFLLDQPRQKPNESVLDGLDVKSITE